ncbi:type II toxin-antitoxin system RelE/ParE family toxin [Methylorubrum sp. POS3]|uniref:type II toxin-antitoxin system RelE/ParE family toxin n=1 Tax=Methylorubrum sp. POS3 TaxID=2998492 RepID=UPI00372BA158
MKIFTTSLFAKLVDKEGVSEADLMEAVDRAERGQIDGPIGKFLIKQRIARPGQGRARGFRSILAYRAGDFAVFLYLFPKSARANLTVHERTAYQDYAETLTRHTDADFARLVAERGWRQIA